jgi:hypothetical protein
MMVWGAAIPDVHPLVASTAVDLLDTVTGYILDAPWIHDPSAD